MILVEASATTSRSTFQREHVAARLDPALWAIVDQRPSRRVTDARVRARLTRRGIRRLCCRCVRQIEVSHPGGSMDNDADIPRQAAATEPASDDEVEAQRRAEIHERAVAIREARRRANVLVPADVEGTWRSGGYRSGRVRTRALVGILAISALADAGQCVMSLQGMGLADAALAGTLTQATAEAFDTTRQQLAIAQVVINLVTFIAMFAWLSRAVDNIPPLTGHTPRFSPRGAIGWWFVPFANYVVPYQIVRDTADRMREGARELADLLVLPWWLLWLINGWLGMIMLRLPSTTIPEIRGSMGLSALASAVSVLGSLLLIVIALAMEERSAALAVAQAQRTGDEDDDADDDPPAPAGDWPMPPAPPRGTPATR